MVKVQQDCDRRYLRAQRAGVLLGEDAAVRGVAEVVNDLKGAGLLPLKAVRVERVDEGDGVAIADGARESEGVVGRHRVRQSLWL